MRLALHLLRQPESQGILLGESLKKLVPDIKYCKNCHNFPDLEICKICSSPKRLDSILCDVEDLRDVMEIENTSKFSGKYLVLGGKISPMERLQNSKSEENTTLKK